MSQQPRPDAPAPRWHSAGVGGVPAGLTWLAPAEQDRVASLRFTKRRVEWLLARHTAKVALAAWLGLGRADRTLARLEIATVLDLPARGAPVVLLDGVAAPASVSLTDRADWAACVVGPPGLALGIDLELDEPRSPAFVATFLTDREQALVADPPHGLESHAAANLVWSAKESALKVLRTGLRRDTRSVEVDLRPVSRSAATPAGWRPLTVALDEGGVVPGWWQRFGPFLLTTASDVPLPPPDPLVEPPPLASAVPSHTWLDQPRHDP